MNPPTRVKHLVNSFWMVETCCCSKKAKTTAPKQRQMVSCEQRGLLRDSEYHAPPSNIWIFFMLWRSPRTIFFFVSCLGKRINPTKRLDGRRGRDCSGISSFFGGKKQSKSDAIRLNSVKPGDCGHKPHISQGLKHLCLFICWRRPRSCQRRSLLVSTFGGFKFLHSGSVLTSGYYPNQTARRHADRQTYNIQC